MIAEIETVAEALFEKIRSRFEGVSMGTAKAEETQDPKQARFFNFDYTDAAGENFGNLTISVVDEENLQLYFGKNISSELDDEQKKEWYDFLRDMRMFAKRNLMNFDIRDISRSALNIKDLKQVSTSSSPETAVHEGRMFGTTKTSYDAISPGTRLVIRHTGAVDETIHGARSRKIQTVYVEDSEGQRLKMPFTNLSGCRALGRHIASEGQMGDDFSKHIIELVEEMSKLKDFIRGSRNKVYEDDEANDMAGAARTRYKELHRTLHKLSSPRGYKFYHTDWKPAKTLQDDIDMQALREKFVMKNFDDRLEQALPHVYSAYKSAKVVEPSPVMKGHLDDFSESLDEIVEGTWALPQNESDIKKLQALMVDALPAGIDGNNATGALYDILGDDDLFDSIYDASRGSPEMDVRPIVYDWLFVHLPNVAEQIMANLRAQEEETESGDDEEMDPRSPATESKYFSVESDSAPYYLHTGTLIETAQKIVRKEHKKGNLSAKIYEMSFKDGKKLKKEYAVRNAPITVESTSSPELAAWRRLAGLR